MLATRVRNCGNFSFRKNVAKAYRIPRKHYVALAQCQNTKYVNLKCSRNPTNSSCRNLTTATLSTIHKTSCLVSDDEKEEFLSVFPQILQNITSESANKGFIEVEKHLCTALQYNVTNGNLIGGFTTVATCKTLAAPENYSHENKQLINILGWCVELLGTLFFITDDIIDASLYRRGVPCWYRNKGVGLQAINDAVMIGNGSYVILKKYFSHLPSYVPLIESFHDAAINTAKGQTLDIVSAAQGKTSLDYFTVSRHNALASYRFNYGMFRLPIISAIHLSNKHDPKMQKHLKNILYSLSHFAQVQNDIEDCFGNPTATGKEGNDIQEGKCSWLVVQALLRATPTQRNILEKNYGKHETECERAVRSLYEELNLINVYEEYKKQITDEINAGIDRLSNEGLKTLFYMLVKHYVHGNQQFFITQL